MTQPDQPKMSAEEIFDEKCFVAFPLPYNEKVEVYYPNAIDAMEQYASQQVAERDNMIESFRAKVIELERQIKTYERVFFGPSFICFSCNGVGYNILHEQCIVCKGSGEILILPITESHT